MQALKRLLIALLLLPMLAAANPVEENNDTPENIQVEVLIFRYTNATSHPEEWQPPSFVNLANAIELVIPEFSIDQTQPNYCLLPTDQMTMTKEEEKLGDNDEFEVLLHVAWVQTMSDSWHSKPVHISGGDNYTIQGELANEVDGTVLVSKSKYLNFKVDLNFTEPLDRIQFESNRKFSPYAQLPYALSYHLSQSRKMKLDELNYIDNPNFGLLVKITPYKKTVEEQTDLPMSDLVEQQA